MCEIHAEFYGKARISKFLHAYTFFYILTTFVLININCSIKDRVFASANLIIISTQFAYASKYIYTKYNNINFRDWALHFKICETGI